jgi:hypothetical protein
MKLLLGIGAVVFLLSITAIEVLSKKEDKAMPVSGQHFSESIAPEYRLPASTSSPL